MKVKLNYLICSILVFLMGFNYQTNAQTRVIEIDTVCNPDKTVDIFYRKNNPGTYTMRIKFSDLENTRASDHQDVLIFSSGKLMTLYPIDSDRPVSFNYSISFMLGNAKPKVDFSYHYVLPFDLNEQRVIEESDISEVKYIGGETWKSYYTVSKTPDMVFAMRKGIVVLVKNEFLTDTETRNMSRKNLVIVEHADGTLASYKGFKLNEINVKVGDMVYPGSRLGKLDLSINNSYYLNFSVLYIAEGGFDRGLEDVLETTRSAYEFLKPYFFTKEGIVQITPKNKYTFDYTEELITREYSKKELKIRN